MNVPAFRFYERMGDDLKGVDAYGKTHSHEFQFLWNVDPGEPAGIQSVRSLHNYRQGTVRCPRCAKTRRKRNWRPEE